LVYSSTELIPVLSSHSNVLSSVLSSLNESTSPLLQDSELAAKAEKAKSTLMDNRATSVGKGMHKEVFPRK